MRRKSNKNQKLHSQKKNHLKRKMIKKKSRKIKRDQILIQSKTMSLLLTGSACYLKRRKKNSKKRNK